MVWAQQAAVKRNIAVVRGDRGVVRWPRGSVIEVLEVGVVVMLALERSHALERLHLGQDRAPDLIRVRGIGQVIPVYGVAPDVVCKDKEIGRDPFAVEVGQL